MKIGIVRERRPYENRVAASPDTIKKFVAMGLDVVVEGGAGLTAAITNASYTAAGATVVKTAAEALGNADFVLKVQKPVGPGALVPGEADEVAMMKDGATLICLMEPYRDRALFDTIAARGITCFAMELVPRISRAQSMDVLSSQSNLAGVSDDDDGRRHRAAGQMPDHGCGRGRSAGDRHRTPLGRRSRRH